jgi:L-seryl-tRNA(Ser) seleniumtransferase
VATVGRVGGGTMPLHEPPSWAVALDDGLDPEALAARLRAGEPPVVTRIADGRVLLDVLALTEADLLRLPALVRRARA